MKASFNQFILWILAVLLVLLTACQDKNSSAPFESMGQSLVGLWLDTQMKTYLGNESSRVLYFSFQNLVDSDPCNGECVEPRLPMQGRISVLPSLLNLNRLGKAASHWSSQQVVSDSKPLHYFRQDLIQGAVTGHGLGGHLFILHEDML